MRCAHLDVIYYSCKKNAKFFCLSTGVASGISSEEAQGPKESGEGSSQGMYCNNSCHHKYLGALVALRVLQPQASALEARHVGGRRVRQEVARAPEAGLWRQRAPEEGVLDVAVLAVQHVHRRHAAPCGRHAAERGPTGIMGYEPANRRSWGGA